MAKRRELDSLKKTGKGGKGRFWFGTFVTEKKKESRNRDEQQSRGVVKNGRFRRVLSNGNNRGRGDYMKVLIHAHQDEDSE